MPVFKTVDIRGQSFFNSLELASKAFRDIKINGILEVILDKKKNYLDEIKTWAATKGFRTSGVNEDSLMVRLFLQKRKPQNQKRK